MACTEGALIGAPTPQLSARERDRRGRAFAEPVIAQSFLAQREGTRGFRAPEVLLQFPTQGPAIDVWSAGVILLVLLTRRASIFDASNDMHALAEICMLVGSDAALR